VQATGQWQQGVEEGQGAGARTTPASLPVSGRYDAGNNAHWAALLSGGYDVLVATPAELEQGLVHAAMQVRGQCTCKSRGFHSSLTCC